MLPKTCQKPSVVCVLHVTNRCFRCLFVLDSRAESRFCKKCHLVVITVEVEMPSVGHNSWQKAEKALADSAGLALRSSGCFRNEARNLPVTSYWQSCLKPRGIFCGCIVIVKNLRDVPRKDWSNSTVQQPPPCILFYTVWKQSLSPAYVIGLKKFQVYFL